MARFTFKVLTYNIHKGFDLYNRQFVLHMIREQLRAVNVDIVFLQEIHGAHERHETRVEDWPEVTQFEFLADQVWSHYAYGRNAIYTSGHHGNAILSKYPIEEWKNINISKWRRASRSLLHGVVRDPETGLRLHVICVHLGLMGYERNRQLDILVKYINENLTRDMPLIIAGDFNDWSGKLGRRLETDLALTEVFRATHGHCARTWPSTWPLLQMDRIYFRGLRLEECHCFSGLPWKRLSDHAPLYARFAMAY
jgi:endonuclease/exonuclease/phosphatase family metal-dependent hydrolase